MRKEMTPDERHDLWKIEHKAWREYALLHEKRNGHLPLVMHQEVYRFFGNRVKITEAHIFDDVKNAEVTIEEGFGDQKVVQFSELELEFVHGVDEPTYPRGFYLNMYQTGTGFAYESKEDRDARRSEITEKIHVREVL